MELRQLRYLCAVVDRGTTVDHIPREQMIVLSDGHCLGDQTLRICRLQRSEGGLECEQLESLLAMVEARLGVGIVPEMATRRSLPGGVVTRRLCAPEPERVISVVRRRSAALHPAAGAFLDHFIRHAACFTAPAHLPDTSTHTRSPAALRQ